MVKTLNQILPKLPVPPHKKYGAPVSLRTVKDELQYAKTKKGRKSRSLLEEPTLKEWGHWILIDNDFPYSAAFKVHHMLIPKREVSKSELNLKEIKELDSIIDELSQKYDCQLVNFKKKQSIKHHYHIHLLIYKDKRRQMKL
ncbi:hypothetical protein KC946_04020 [Candidatus Saccharibacteria bacterium]|nr:hypothetical protein [Candidatus Saccharibacteria bacterium]